MRQLFCRVRATSFVAGVVALIVAASAAQVHSAQKKNTEPQKASNHQLVQAIHVLQSVKKTLEAADHDYGGHRAETVKQIGVAEKQLHEALEYIHKQPIRSGNGGKGAGKGKAHPEPQQLSDAELAGAVPVLKETATLLEKADHDYGGHRAKAVSELKSAVTQLEKALKFSKANDQNKP